MAYNDMNVPNLLGLSGAIIAGLAYVPQIIHLIKEHCTSGLSRGAFALWWLSSILITINAVYIHSIVFIVLGVIQILATAIIFAYTSLYRHQACPFHAHPNELDAK
jgi:uncharacterized protein with PQ loop repeat